MFTIANACDDLDDKGIFTVSYWSVNIMVRYSIEQRAFLIETYFAKKKSVKCIRKFCLKFPDSPVPSQPHVNLLILSGIALVPCWTKRKKTQAKCVDRRKVNGYSSKVATESPKIT
jgi:hypothetical protein